eukprot:3778766-Pleurochrysis_carterae.AAC.1
MRTVHVVLYGDARARPGTHAGGSQNTRATLVGRPAGKRARTSVGRGACSRHRRKVAQAHSRREARTRAQTRLCTRTLAFAHEREHKHARERAREHTGKHTGKHSVSSTRLRTQRWNDKERRVLGLRDPISVPVSRDGAQINRGAISDARMTYSPPHVCC